MQIPKKLKRHLVMLDKPSVTKARRIGEGNISKGIRKAVKEHGAKNV